MVSKNLENQSKQSLIAEISRLKQELKKKKKYGLVWEDKTEDVVELCKDKLPVVKDVKNIEMDFFGIIKNAKISIASHSLYWKSEKMYRNIIDEFGILS